MKIAPTCHKIKITDSSLSVTARSENNETFYSMIVVDKTHFWRNLLKSVLCLKLKRIKDVEKNQVIIARPEILKPGMTPIFKIKLRT